MLHEDSKNLSRWSYIGQPQGTTTYLSGLYKAIAELNLAEIFIACCTKKALINIIYLIRI